MALPAQPDALPAWRTIRAQLRRCVGESQYEIWLSPLTLRSWDGELLLLSAPAPTRSWVNDRFRPVLERCARETLGDRARVALDAGEARDASAANTRAVPAPTEAFNPRYSFEQFIIGQGNRLAHAAALAVAEHPGQAYNPLFLHAPPGLGKTHLLHAIGNYVQAFGGGATVRYTTAEAFTNHFLTALTTKALEPFKRAYRSADVLLIDDVQFLASKARTEEEFFHTFNALYENGRQLVLTCDRLPRSLLEVEVRLRERFESGLVADIAPPDHATRVAILRKRAALDRLQLGDVSVLDLIASRVTTNIRALEGALIRVVAYHSLTQRPVDLALATEVMDSIYPLPGFAEVTIGAVQAKVAGHYRLTVPELISASRTARVTWPRQVAIHLTRELTGASLQAIGEAFGGRNHATVLHACKRVAQRLATGDGMSTELDALSQQIRQPPADRDY
ncbi:MAG: chromosomal replication initiator protein DnaA [Actinomycetota bacterium]|nr:chromosomal replication initiator protein DnaA [Actinomycetota bacterium]